MWWIVESFRKTKIFKMKSTMSNTVTFSEVFKDSWTEFQQNVVVYMYNVHALSIHGAKKSGSSQAQTTVEKNCTQAILNLTVPYAWCAACQILPVLQLLSKTTLSYACLIHTDIMQHMQTLTTQKQGYLLPVYEKKNSKWYTQSWTLIYFDTCPVGQMRVIFTCLN